MKGAFFASEMDAVIVGVKGIIHRVTPIMARMMPTIGARGITGHRMISARLMMPPMMIMRVPAISSNNREKKPMMRETRRSINMWNLRSREELAAAELAEI